MFADHSDCSADIGTIIPTCLKIKSCSDHNGVWKLPYSEKNNQVPGSLYSRAWRVRIDHTYANWVRKSAKDTRKWKFWPYQRWLRPLGDDRLSSGVQNHRAGHGHVGVCRLGRHLGASQTARTSLLLHKERKLEVSSQTALLAVMAALERRLRNSKSHCCVKRS